MGDYQGRWDVTVVEVEWTLESEDCHDYEGKGPSARCAGSAHGIKLKSKLKLEAVSVLLGANSHRVRYLVHEDRPEGVDPDAVYPLSCIKTYGPAGETAMTMLSVTSSV